VQLRIDLNADLGEGFGPWRMGDDAALLDLVSSANIACGFHAGDPEIMRATVRAAVARGVSIGAHPGFEDLRGFGRRRLPISEAEAENLIAYQVGALCGVAALEGAVVRHVKPHGALANLCQEDDGLALAVGRAIKAVDPKLLFLVMPGLAMARAAEKLGLGSFAEIYADRTYADSFNLTDRRSEGAVIHDANAAAVRVAEFVKRGVITAMSGKELPVRIDAVCVHGDNPEALLMARAVRRVLEEAGYAISPHP